MKNYRLLLVGFVSVSYVFLSGFNQSVDQSPTQQDTKKHHAVKRPDTVLTDKARIDDAKELQRPLDLTIPFKAAKDAEESGQTTDDGTQGAADVLFAPKPKKTEQPVQLKGGWLMSPEPEEEKKKSVDGAGIIIDLKP